MTKTSKQIILLHVIEKEICNFKMKWFDKKIAVWNCIENIFWNALNLITPNLMLMMGCEIKSVTSNKTAHEVIKL